MPTGDGQVVLAELLAGNKRYRAGQTEADRGVQRRCDLVSGQSPIAIIIGCSDSRVPPDVIFDQPLGALFVVRTAGHVLSDIGLGSVEYAADHLEIPLLIVLGHERCGAVTAAIAGESADGGFGTVLDEIAMSIDAKEEGDTERRVSATVRRHAVRTAAGLRTRSDVIRARVDRGTLDIATAIYDLDSGIVTVLPRSS